MTRRVPDCVVYVEDSRLDDTGAALALADPVALDGLRVTWGRTTTVDQPEPAALSLTLLDPEGARHSWSASTWVTACAWKRQALGGVRATLGMGMTPTGRISSPMARSMTPPSLTRCTRP